MSPLSNRDDPAASALPAPSRATTASEGPHAPAHADEFPPGASEWPAGLSRRQFIEVMGASLALAGLGACNRPPEKTIVPYVTPPDRQLTDGALYYATAMPWEGYARGVLALSNSGRPTKLEGNPAHPDSLGATDIFMQASVLALYDPDRSRAPRQRHVTTAWAEFEAEWLQAHAELRKSRGAKLALLIEPTTSPTLLRGIHHFLGTFPEARWYQHTPLPRYDRNGTQDDYDFEKADIILAIDSDFLLRHPASLRYTRAFARRRRVEHGRVNGNRLYVIESDFSLTGSMADHRLPATPARQQLLLGAVRDALTGKQPGGDLTQEEQRVVTALAADLRQKAPNVLCVAGEMADPAIRDWAAAMNAQLGADGVTRFALPAARSDADSRSAGDLAALTHAIGAGEVETLIVIGTNPAYTAPADLKFVEALGKVPRRIHLGSHVDETAVLCDWHIPESHYLEAWSDLRAYDGTVSVVQPLIAPMYASRSAAEFVFFLADGLERNDYDLVRETWQPKNGASAEFERQWLEVLNKGISDGSANKRTKPAGGGADSGDATPSSRSGPDATRASHPQQGNGAPSVTLVIRPDPTISDGRWANNGWLQELPKANWQLVWDNAAQVSPAYAGHHGLKTGDVVALRTAAGTVHAPIWIAPGVADDCVVVFLGYGRTHAGKIGTHVGYDAFRVRSAKAPWSTELLELRKTGDKAELVSTHSHYTMEGRDIVRIASAANPTGTAGPKPEAPPSMFPDWKYNGYRWGMLIDLAACIGCKACVIACQAENNIAVVGKDQVARGREMHWIRVDQYYDGNPDNPQVFHQPVPCMQCERAPCEVVCPVAATVHSAEGLNDMVYNRCIGTRYCSNNCPYKVRRFNFLDYRAPKDSTLYLQKNPDVTVRARGVMEKCTYCVQRIDAARIKAEREDRRVRDGELQTACQQACPAEAIVFGDLNDAGSRVRARKAEPTNYALLEELNTQPRTTYLAKILNKNDAVFTGAEPKTHG